MGGVVDLRDHSPRESVGLADIGARSEITAMDLTNGVRLHRERDSLINSHNQDRIERELREIERALMRAGSVCHLREHEQVVVAFELLGGRVVLEHLHAEILLGELVLLDGGPHRAVNHHNPGGHLLGDVVGDRLRILVARSCACGSKGEQTAGLGIWCMARSTWEGRGAAYCPMGDLGTIPPPWWP